VFAVIATAPLWQRMLVLLPAFLIGAGIVFASLILLGRALAHSVRESGHQRLIYVGFVALLGVVALLTYLGVELPRE
jgi:hypothetical protein